MVLVVKGEKQIMDVFEKALSGYYDQSQLPSKVSKKFEDEIEAQIEELDNVPLTVRERLEKGQELRELLQNKRKEVYWAYRKDLDRLYEEFQRDVEKELKFDHLPTPIKESIHGYAWERGHSSGYGEVLNYCIDLAGIVLAAYNAGKQNQ